jgi:hypothetical protein
MRVRGFWQVFLSVVLLAAAGCYAPFNPQWGRHEIKRQTGEDPRDSFEFNLGEATMKLAKSVVSGVAGEPVNFGGLERIDVEVYELPPGRRLDFNRIDHRGWEKLVGTKTDKWALMILVRTNGERLKDLVLVAQGDEQVLYGRLKGNLDPGLPSTLEGVLESKGLQGLKEKFLSQTPARKTTEPPPAPRPKKKSS